MCRLVVRSELDADWKSCCCPISDDSAIHLSTSATPTTGRTPNPVPSTSDFPSPSQCSLDAPPALRGLFQPCREHSNFYMIGCQFDPDHESHKKLPYHKTIATEDIPEVADVPPVVIIPEHVTAAQESKVKLRATRALWTHKQRKAVKKHSIKVDSVTSLSEEVRVQCCVSG